MSGVLISWLRTLRRGDVVTGTVSRIENFGVFVDVDGAPVPETGFVSVAELSWRWVPSCEAVVSVGDRVEAEVIDIDLQFHLQARLSLKALQPDPWQDWAGRVGAVVPGRVTNLTPIGVFVQVGDGIEALLREPGPAVRVGDEVDVRVVEVQTVGLRRMRVELID